jgi:RNA polymerase sigma-70 factor, ECF subfamily
MITSVNMERGGETLGHVIRDRERFVAWYEATLPAVYAYLFSRCGGNAAVAEELTQEVFIAAIQGHHRYRGHPDGAAAWLVGIARHRFVDHIRRQAREQARTTGLTRRETPAPPLGMSDRLQLVELIGTLPPVQRAALIMFAVDGLSIREVASHLGRSEDATESLIRRARSSLRAAREATS